MSPAAPPTDRRLVIAEAAMRVVAAEGPDRLTLRRVAAEAGQTTGAVTHHFADREALLLAALEAADLGIRARLTPAVTSPATLVAAALALLPYDAHARACWATWTAFADRVRGSSALLRAAREQESTWLAEARRALQAAGMSAPDTALEAEAELFLAVMDGLGWNISSDPRRWPPARARRVLEAYVARLPRRAARRTAANGH